MERPDTLLYRAAQVRELDRLAIETFGIPGYTLMCRAGDALLAVVREHFPRAHRLVVLCGPGNNGGDGYVVARLAREAGFHVRLFRLADPERIRGDAARARQAWLAAGGGETPWEGRLPERSDLLVDALLGTGLERPVEGAFLDAIRAMDAHPAPVVAADIPSGLHADSGAVLGAAARAAVTVTFIGLKQGLFTGAGPDRCGEIRYHRLGAPAEIHRRLPASARLMEDTLRDPLRRPRPRDAHKGRFGHLLVVGGAPGMSGAARLAGEAALRSGAGLVSVATHPRHAAHLNAGRPELMVHGVAESEELRPLLERAGAVAIGPGLGREGWGRVLLEACLATDLPLVVDADALNLLAEDVPRSRGRWVVTPHPGEAARLLGMTVPQVQADRFHAVRALAEATGAVAVLKGAGTLVHDDSGTLVCHRGNPGMASGGTGDLLTGIVGALLAQGMEAGEAARLGVWLHALAGDRAAGRRGERGLLASDLLDELPLLVNPPQGATHGH